MRVYTSRRRASSLSNPIHPRPTRKLRHIGGVETRKRPYLLCLQDTLYLRSDRLMYRHAHTAVGILPAARAAYSLPPDDEMQGTNPKKLQKLWNSRARPSDEIDGLLGRVPYSLLVIIEDGWNYGRC